VSPSAPSGAGDGLRNTAANTAPTALFTVSPRWPRPGDTVTVDASYSLDRDGSVVAYEWDLGNGTTQVTSAQARAVYTSAGSYPVSVTVVDDSGSRSTQTLSLVVSATGAPATAVDSAQSLVVAASTSLLASATTVVTVTTRNALGLPVPNAPVWLSGRGREWRVTQPSAVTTSLGIASGTVGSAVTQSAQIVAIADFTLLRPVNVSIGATNLSLTRSSVRLTDPVVSFAGDSTLFEVTARDTVGNPLVGATITVTVTGGTSIVRNEGQTDASGRRAVVIEPTTCGGATLSVTASVNGTPLPMPATITAAAPGVYGVCGAALWLDADDAGTLTQSGGILTAWRDKSGSQRHSVATEGPTVVAGGLNGRTALRFNGTGQFVPIADVVSGTPYTLIVVERRRSGRSTNFVIGGTTPLVSNTLQLGYQSGTSLRFATFSDNLDAAMPTFTGIATEPGRVHIGRWTSGSRSLLSNSALLAADLSLLGVTAWAGAAVGRHHTGGALAYYDGDVGELVVFRRALNQAEYTTISNALMLKWSLGTLTATAGQTQAGVPGQAATTAPRVRVRNAATAPLAGATVTWQVISGGGTIGSQTTITDSNGDASASWTLGSGATNTLRATYGTQTADFTATTSSVCVSSAICDPALWVDATDGSTITTEGGVVTEWRDKSGWGRHFTASSTSAPSVQSNPLALKNMLRFSGTNVMTLADRPWTGTGDYTLVVVERRRATGPAPFFGRAAAGGNAAPILGYNSSTAAYVTHGTSPLMGTVAAFVSATVQATRVWSVRYTSGTRTLRVNNVQIGSDNTTGPVTTFSGATLGRHDAQWYTGDIGEVVLIPRAVNSAELQTYTLSLMAKWGAGVLTIDAGNGQTASAGTSPATAPRVRLSDGNGNGIPGVNLVWQVTFGGGRLYDLTSFTTLTNATGHADIPSGNWRLDNGLNQLVVWQSVSAGQGPSVAIAATGELPPWLAVHFDAQAAYTFTLNGANVARWKDNSGGSTRSVEQTSPAQQPILSTSAINGRPAVVFDGTDDVLIGNAVSYGITGARSVFMVVRTTGAVTSGSCSSDDGQYLLDRNPSANNQPRTSIKAVSGRWVVQTRTDGGSVTGCAPASGGVFINPNSTTILGVIQTTSSISLWWNGTSAGSASFSGINTMQPIVIGRNGAQATGPYLPGAVGEVLVFPTALSTADRQIVERYLGWKWGVAVLVP